MVKLPNKMRDLLGVVADIQTDWLYLDARTLSAHFGSEPASKSWNFIKFAEASPKTKARMPAAAAIFRMSHPQGSGDLILSRKNPIFNLKFPEKPMDIGE